MTPLAAVVTGLLAGAAGTVCLDAVHYLKYRRVGGTDRALAWEFAPVESWESVPEPGQVAKTVAWDLGAHLAYGAGYRNRVLAAAQDRLRPRTTDRNKHLDRLWPTFPCQYNQQMRIIR
jgi:hypothetical protein